MRAAVRLARRSTAVYTEDTLNILRQLIFPSYLVVILMFPIMGYIGDHWAHYPNLGYFPGFVGIVLTGYMWWALNLRIITPVAITEFARKHERGVLGKVFYVISQGMLWMPVVLWVPSMFPVWRSLYLYLAFLAITVTASNFVATETEFNIKRWRKLYGIIMIIYTIRMLCLATDVHPWAGVSLSLPSLDDIDPFMALVAFGVVICVIAALRPSRQPSGQ